MSQAGKFERAVGGGPVTTLQGASGGVVPPTGAGNINIVGSGPITTVGDPGTNKITITSTGGGIKWNSIAGNTQALAVNEGYINNNAGLTTFTLPAVAVVGDVIRIAGRGAGGWLIAQNALQNIQVGAAAASTTGVGGSVASINQFDCVELLCVVANTTFEAITFVGTLNIV